MQVVIDSCIQEKSVVAQVVGVVEGVAGGAEALVGPDASVVGLVGTLPVRSTFLATLTPPSAVTNANVLEQKFI